MIIWGSKAKEKTISSGPFFCPSCQLDATYDHIRVGRYFTLYFIPLFSMSTLGEYIKCRNCQAGFEPSVLDLSRTDILEATQPWRCARCGNRNSPAEDSCLGCGTNRSAASPAAAYDIDD